jgi:site-specific recombinase XerD
MKELDMFVRNMTITGKSGKTIKQFSNYIEEFFEILKISTLEDLSALTLSDFDLYLEFLQNKGNGDSTRNTKLSGIKSFYKYLNDNEIIDKNVAERVKHSKTQKKVSVQPTKEEAKKILQSVKHKPKLFALYTLLMNSGLRIEEALSLRLGDIRDGCIYVINGKGGKDRLVLINSTAVETLEKYIATYRKSWDRDSLMERHNGNLKRVKQALEDSDLIFLGKNGLRMYNSNLNVSMDYTAKVCNISPDKVHPHAFRHYFANEFIRQGGNIQELKSQLGHESIATTQLYFKTDISAIQRTMSTMSF